MNKEKNTIANWFSNQISFDKVVELSRLTGIAGSTQILIQGIGLVSGILIIRLLPTEQYALYTLANTMLGTMVVLADSGIASGVTTQSGKVWRNREQLGRVLETGLDLRRKFAVGSLLIAAPILLYLLHHHGASWFMSLLVLLSLIPAFISSLTGAIFMIPLKLHQDIAPLQKNLVRESLLRFASIGALLILPWTFIAILAAGLPRLYTNLQLRRLSERYVSWKQEIDKNVRREILSIVKRLMPGAIYYCVAGQISIWLISVFGTTAGVAQIGALGRIAIIVTTISMVFGTVVYPRYARLPNDHALLLKRFVHVWLALASVCAAVLLGVWLLSSQILWVLGPEYAGLERELVLSLMASCIGLVSGGAFTMSVQRGWAIHPGLSIPVSIASIAAGAAITEVSSLEGVLKFNIFVVAIQLMLNTGYFFFRLRSEKANESSSEPNQST